MKHIASCSFGKDSLATVLLALRNDEPLDEVVYCEVMFDRETSGEIPEHIEFIRGTAIPFLQREGIKVVELQSKKTYIDHFFGVSKSGRSKGKIHGFPLCGKCAICRDCKLPPIKEYQETLSAETIQYVGIAKDEQERLLRLKNNRVSLLDKYGFREIDAFDLCRRHGLLSPIYEFAERNGCFFCPNAKEKELRHLYDYHPDLWGRMLELQNAPNKCTELFNREFTFAQIDSNFRFDDTQITFDEVL